MKEKIMRIAAAIMFVVAAFVMVMAANLPEQPRLAPKTKAPIPCPECPLQTGYSKKPALPIPCPGCPAVIVATWAVDENGKQILILKEQQLPKPLLFASPAARPQPPIPVPSPAAVVALR
jgi:hypothetical protein